MESVCGWVGGWVGAGLYGLFSFHVSVSICVAARVATYTSACVCMGTYCRVYACA